MNLETTIVDRKSQGEQDPRPIVALPRAGLGGATIAAISVVLAILLFLMLNARRERVAIDSTASALPQAGAFAPPPPLSIPVEPQAESVPVIAVAPVPGVAPMAAPQTRVVISRPSEQSNPVPFQPPAFIPPTTTQEALPTLFSRETSPIADLKEPALVIDVAAPKDRSSGGQAASPNASAAAVKSTASDGASRQGSRIGNRATTLAVGTLIPAVLETPLDTSRPGFARAIVSQDTRGYDGQRVLVPRGSKLIGEYQSDVQSGQKRVLVNWTSLILPDGSTIALDSPAADALGGSGLPGRAKGFFLARFAEAVLQSALAVGSNLATWTNRAPVIIGLPTQQVNAIAGQASSAGGGRKRTIRVKQGTPFNIFVAQNLDFSGSASRQAIAP